MHLEFVEHRYDKNPGKLETSNYVATSSCFMHQAYEGAFHFVEK